MPETYFDFPTEPLEGEELSDLPPWDVRTAPIEEVMKVHNTNRANALFIQALERGETKGCLKPIEPDGTPAE